MEFDSLILFLFLLTFGPPVLFFLIGIVTWRRKRNTAKVFLIVGAVWLIIGGGTCLSILMG
jgi:hypothetical protein